MKVIAKKGTRCPKEGSPREYITDDIAQDAPETSYYTRLIADGSLLILTEPETKPSIDERISKKGGKG